MKATKEKLATCFVFFYSRPFRGISSEDISQSQGNAGESANFMVLVSNWDYRERMAFLRQTPSGVLIDLHVQPQASRTEIVGLHGDRLKLRVKAPPIDGAANQEVIRFLAEQLSCPRQHLEIIKGQSGRQKTILARSMSLDHIQSKIAVQK